MNSITRYSPAEWSHNWDVVPSVSGTYVRHSDHISALAELTRERDAARASLRSEHSFVRQKESEISALRDDRYVLASECAAARELHVTSIVVINDGWPQEAIAAATATLKAARSATDASQALVRASRSIPNTPTTSGQGEGGKYEND